LKGEHADKEERKKEMMQNAGTSPECKTSRVRQELSIERRKSQRKLLLFRRESVCAKYEVYGRGDSSERGRISTAYGSNEARAVFML